MKKLEFDYIIVGGGSAGCVIAARLASETQNSVASRTQSFGDVFCP